VKKGFTLIELLAVILILGIIALIAIPTVNTIIVEARERAFVVSVRNLTDVVSNKCFTETMNNTTITTYYSITDGVITPGIEIKGELPSNGKLYVNTDCEVKVEVNNQNNLIKKDYDEKDFIVEKFEEKDSKYVNMPFSMGDLVTVDGQNWRVLKDSLASDETVVLLAENVYPSTVAVTKEENNTTIWKETELNQRLNTTVDGTKNEFGYDLSKYEEFETFISDSYDINGGQELNPGTKMRLVSMQEYVTFRTKARNLSATWAFFTSGSGDNARYGDSIGGWWTMGISSSQSDRFWYVDNNSLNGTIDRWCVSFNISCYHLKPVIKVKKENIEDVLYYQEEA
jgi:prepilin-type N-terminal cleavage/methylation domain-containing protein